MDHTLPPRGSCTRNAPSLIVLHLTSKDGTYRFLGVSQRTEFVKKKTYLNMFLIFYFTLYLNNFSSVHKVPDRGKLIKL